MKKGESQCVEEKGTQSPPLCPTGHLHHSLREQYHPRLTPCSWDFWICWGRSMSISLS